MFPNEIISLFFSCNPFDRETILVNRGHVPFTARPQQLRQDGQVRSFQTKLGWRDSFFFIIICLIIFHSSQYLKIFNRISGMKGQVEVLMNSPPYKNWT